MYSKKFPERKEKDLNKVVQQYWRSKSPVPDVLVTPPGQESLAMPETLSSNPEVGNPDSGRRSRRSSASPTRFNRNNSIIERGTQYYTMDHPRRGDFVIFNFNVFGPNARNGALKDTENLTRCFSTLGFDVIVKLDRTEEEVFSTIDEISQKDYSDAACYAMAILGHGKEGIISVANGEVKLDRIISKVKKCHNLQGKPKLFFVQSCRIIGGLETDAISQDAIVNDYTPIVSIDADLLISYATTKGNVAFRIPETGSPYITKLTEVLEELGTQESILDLLTEVNAKVNGMVQEYGFSQITVLESTLNKKLVFDKVEEVFPQCRKYNDGRIEFSASNN